MELIDELGAVDLDELTARMDTIEGTVNAAVATANAASQQAQNAANTATAMGNRVTDLETLTTDQGQSIRTLQSVSNDHTEDITALENFNQYTTNTYQLDGIPCIFRKVGRTVTVVFAGAPTDPVPTNGLVTPVTIDQKYRPATAQIYYITANTQGTMQAKVEPDGTFTIGYASTQLTTAIRGTFAYFSAN